MWKWLRHVRLGIILIEGLGHIWQPFSQKKKILFFTTKNLKKNLIVKILFSLIKGIYLFNLIISWDIIKTLCLHEECDVPH